MITRFFIGIGRHIRDGFRNFFRNFGLSLSSLASINVTLIVVGFAILMGANFDTFASKIENNVTIVAYINLDVPAESISQMESDLNARPDISEVVYSTKEEELEKVIVEQDLQNIADQYRGENNPLNNVFYIKAADVQDVDGVVQSLNESGNYESVKYGATVVDKVVNMFYYARILTVILIALLLLVTVFIIYNTIRITIYTRSVHVEIMKLIGASNYHITMPYIYEGMLIGIFGSIVPILVIVFGYRYFYREYGDSEVIKTFVNLVNPDPIVYYIAGFLLVVGIVVGVLGSALSIRRFVRK